MDDQTGQISLKTILAVFGELKSGRHAALAPATNSNQLCTTENAEFGVLGRKRLKSQLTLVVGLLWSWPTFLDDASVVFPTRWCHTFCSISATPLYKLAVVSQIYLTPGAGNGFRWTFTVC